MYKVTARQKLTAKQIKMAETLEKERVKFRQWEDVRNRLSHLGSEFGKHGQGLGLCSDHNLCHFLEHLLVENDGLVTHDALVGHFLQAAAVAPRVERSAVALFV